MTLLKKGKAYLLYQQIMWNDTIFLYFLGDWVEVRFICMNSTLVIAFKSVVEVDTIYVGAKSNHTFFRNRQNIRMKCSWSEVSYYSARMNKLYV